MYYFLFQRCPNCII